MKARGILTVKIKLFGNGLLKYKDGMPYRTDFQFVLCSCSGLDGWSVITHSFSAPE